MIRAIKNSIVFTFKDIVRNGQFHEVSTGGIILPTDNDNNAKAARWGTVITVGPEVTDIEPGDQIYVEALQWTAGITYNGIQLWKTNSSKVLAVDDNSLQKGTNSSKCE